MSKTFKDYKELLGYDESLAKELLNLVGEGDWQDDQLHLYSDLEDYAEYELTEGWYAGLGFDFDIDYNGAPDLINHINLTSLGDDLASSWDESCNFKSEKGSVITTGYGW